MAARRGGGGNLHFGALLLAVVLALILWSVAHGTSPGEKGFDVPVQLDGLADSLVVTAQSADGVNVRVRGSRAALRNVDGTGLVYRVNVEGGQPGVAEYEVDISRIDLPRGARVVSRSPSRIEVSFERRGRKVVGVRPDIEGEPAEGYLLRDIEVTPRRVWLAGARSQVLRLSEVVTEPIDVTGLSAPQERQVSLFLGEGTVWLEENEPVTVKLLIERDPKLVEAEAKAAAEAAATAEAGAKALAGQQPARSGRMSERERQLFGTDGIRGTANVYPMTADMALRLGQAVGHVLQDAIGDRPRIVIAKDTRLSGYMFEDALASGLCSMGVEVIQVGPMPTPGLAFLSADMRCDAGIMISASHNPYQDNGIKFFGADGYKFADRLEERIEELVFSGTLADHLANADEVGQARRIDDADGRYVVFLKNTFPRELTLDGLRVVLDCANGAAYKVGPTVLRELGAEVFLIGVEPNGRNINSGCGSLHPARTAEKVRELRADIGVAVDGDADRVVLVDERGAVLDGDQILSLCARDLQNRKLLKGGGVVATVMSNLGLERSLDSMGLELVRTQVGDRFVVEAMRQGGYNVGGEQSGHLVFLDHTTTGDGLMTALQTLAIMRRSERTLSELTASFERFPQVMINIPIAEKRPLESLPSMMKAVREVESELGNRGRVLIRYSGTELKARVMVEGEDEARVSQFARQLADQLGRALAGSAA